MRVPFVGGSNKSKTVNVTAQRTVNMCVQLDQEGKYPAYLHSRPGMSTYAPSGSAAVRGMMEFDGALYCVTGGDLKKVTTSQVVSLIGSLDTVSGRVSMAQNPTQLMMVDGTYGYTTDGTTLTKIADAQFPNGATHVVYLDGYFIVNDPANRGRFSISALNDGTAWAALDYATASRSPDKLKALLALNRQLWLIGESSTEAWWNSGNPDFPFEATESGYFEWGIAAAHSAAVAKSFSGDEVAVLLARNDQGHGVVMSSTGRISTPALEEEIGGYSTISDAYAWVMNIEGHIFYVLTFPTEPKTWVYDFATSQWAEWKSYGSERFRGSAHAFFDNKHILGDYQDGTLLEMDDTLYQDAGSALECIRQDRFIHADRKWLFHRRLEIECEGGVGTASLDPQVMLQWSDDGGHTFSNEHWRGIGKVGKYKNRAYWNQLGRSRDRIYRVTFTDNARFTIVSGHIEVDLGAA